MWLVTQRAPAGGVSFLFGGLTQDICKAEWSIFSDALSVNGEPKTLSGPPSSKLLVFLGGWWQLQKHSVDPPSPTHCLFLFSCWTVIRVSELRHKPSSLLTDCGHFPSTWCEDEWCEAEYTNNKLRNEELKSQIKHIAKRELNQLFRTSRGHNAIKRTTV